MEMEMEDQAFVMRWRWTSVGEDPDDEDPDDEDPDEDPDGMEMTRR
jgi:hypothetical protein